MRKVACFLASVALALSACSSPEEAGGDPETEETTAAQATTEETETQAPEETNEVTPSEDSESAAESAAGDNDRDAQEAEEEGQNGDEECVPPVPGAYPCAGGPRPAEARMLQDFPPTRYSVDRRTGLIMPSGNVMCDIEPDALQCWVRSWDRDTMMPGLDPSIIGGGVTVELGVSGPTKLGLISEVPAVDYTKNEGTPVTRPEYGSVWYYEDFVLASLETGLTVWNTKTGYGALMNRSGYYPFP